MEGGTACLHDAMVPDQQQAILLCLLAQQQQRVQLQLTARMHCRNCAVGSHASATSSAQQPLVYRRCCQPVLYSSSCQGEGRAAAATTLWQHARRWPLACRPGWLPGPSAPLTPACSSEVRRRCVGGNRGRYRGSGSRVVFVSCVGCACDPQKRARDGYR